MPILAPWILAAAASATPHLPARRTASTPVIDGRLDDRAWSDAVPTSAFTQKFPDEGAPPTERTTVRILYDDDALYVGVDCVQEHSPVVPRLTRRDRAVESDWIAIDLDTRRDGKSAVEFLVNASGVMVDGVRANDVDYSADWDEAWEAATWIGEGRWSAEIKIPLRILRFARGPVQSWGLELRRYVSARQETDEWAYIPRTAAAEVSRYGRLDDLRGLEPKSPLELRPFVVGRLRSRDPSEDTTGHGLDLGASAGLDLKWHATQDLTLDATVNPDFALVEADQVVLNLTTYEVYKPEKRPFFLEGTELVAPRLGLPLVYTKRIGRAPDLPQLRYGPPFSEKLVDLPEPSPIWGATKLTGRAGEAWSVGTLSALVGPNDVMVDPANGPRAARRIEPMTAFNVLRVKYDVAPNAHVGLLLTGTTRAERAGDYAPSPGVLGRVLCPNQTRADGSIAPIDAAAGGRCFHDAYVAGIDARMRRGDWVTTGQVVASAIERGPPRPQPDGTVIGAGDVAPATDFYVGKEGGEHVTTYAWYGNAGRKLDFNDLGFMWRQNVRYAGGGVEYRTLEPWWTTLETHTTLDVNGADNLSGLRLGREAYLGESWKFRGFWTVGLSVGYRAPRFDDREVGDGTALERGRMATFRARVNGDPRGRVVVNGTATWIAVEAGYSGTLDANVTVRVLPQLDLEVAPQASVAHGEPRYATEGARSGVHLYAPLAASNLSAIVRATYTFGPRLSFVAYTQGFLAAGHFGDLLAPRPGTGAVVRLSDLAPSAEAAAYNPDFQQGAINANVSLRWEYALGSFLSVVYARTQSPKVLLGPTESAAIDLRSIGRAPAVDALYLKLSYFWG
jgi:hypothetical protein